MKDDIKIGDRVAICGVSTKGRWYAVPETQAESVNFFSKGEVVEGSAAPTTGWYCGVTLKGKRLMFHEHWVRKLEPNDPAYRDMHLDDTTQGKRV